MKNYTRLGLVAFLLLVSNFHKKSRFKDLSSLFLK